MKNWDPRRFGLQVGLGFALFITSCNTPQSQPKSESLATEISPSPNEFITFQHELEGFYIIFDTEQFIDISRRYGVPDANFRDFDIKLTKEIIGANSPIEDPSWVTVSISEDKRGSIEVAFGTILKEFLKVNGIKENEIAEEAYLSVFTSYGVFTGYLDLGVQRGLFSKEWADKTGILYLNRVLNAEDKLILGVNIQKPESPLPPQEPIIIPPFDTENS